MTLSLAERIRGCLLGGACGDALGAPVEFLSTGAIVSQHGSKGITDFDVAYGRRGAITDDSQMTIFTVDGIIRSIVREKQRGIGADWPAVVHHAYLRWLATQKHQFLARGDVAELDGWIIEDARLWSQRAPGATCISALNAANDFGSHAANNSKGCGTVMRDAPWGLAFAGQPQRAFDLASEAARTTHGHPSAASASGAVAAIVARICAGVGIAEAVEQTISEQLQHADASEVAYALSLAMSLSGDGWRSSLLELGQGWVAEEALAIAVLCAVSAQNPKAALIAAVNHDGDSDSTGAICGNLLGAQLGASAFPAEWIAAVELGDLLEALSSDLASAVAGQFDVDALSKRYPGW